MKKEERKVPEYLKHKPIYAINNYDEVDGNYRDNTDVYGISLGKAQWTSAEEFVPSLKVWRKPNDKWSRQSEETTITRAFDLAMLAVKVLGYECKKKDISNYSTPFGEIEISKTGVAPKYIEELSKYMKEHQKDLEAHLQMLKEAVDSYYDD